MPNAVVVQEPQVLPPAVPTDYTAAYVTPAELVDILLGEHQGYILSFAYQTDMLAKGKLLVSARAAFPNGLYRHRRLTANVSYDYEAKMERRGDEAAGTGNWSQALVKVEVGTGREFVTPFAVHKDDISGVAKSGLPTFNTDSPRVYLRYEPPSKAQRDTNFCANDYDYYADKDGTIVNSEEVKKHYGKRSSKPTVEHRLLALSNCKRVYLHKRVLFVT